MKKILLNTLFKVLIGSTVFYISILIIPKEYSNINRYLLITYFIFLGYLLIKLFEEEKVLKKRSKEIENEVKDEMKLKKIDQAMYEIDIIEKEIFKINNLNIVEVKDYKKNILEHENEIIKKGGKEQLYLFLKIDTFLNDFKDKITEDKEEILANLPDSIKNLKSDVNHFGYLQNSRWMEKHRETYFVFENRNKTLEFYQSIAGAMIMFYINEKNILYYEIFEAFEKLGVFDSTWQKIVLKKVKNIENSLDEINDKMTLLNAKFSLIVNHNEKIVEELKKIESSSKTTNMIQAISLYQLWRNNKELKRNNKQN